MQTTLLFLEQICTNNIITILGKKENKTIFNPLLDHVTINFVEYYYKWYQNIASSNMP